MRTLTAFIFTTLDGYFKDMNDDISWHPHGGEESEFSADNLKKNNILLFGRKTYEMMAGFWPTQAAFAAFPEVAKGMNKAEKIVFSKTLTKPDWVNTTIISKDMIEETEKLKQREGKDLTLLGSGSILTQLATENLVDEYQIMLDPIAIGSGTPVFKDLRNHLSLQLTNTRVFKSGTIVLYYKPLSL